MPTTPAAPTRSTPCSSSRRRRLRRWTRASSSWRRASGATARTATGRRAATVRCPRCRRPTAAPFPAPVARPVQYGPRLLGLGVYLRHYQLLPYRRIGELLADLFGAGPSVGTLHTASLACAGALAG